MIRSKNLLVSLVACGLVLLSFLLTAASAADDAPRGPAATKSADSTLEQMDRTLQLTDDQKAKLKPLIDTMDEELDDLRQDSIVKIRGSMQDAKGKASGKRQQMAEELKKANADFQNLLDTHQTKINAVLTPEQQVT